MPILHQENVLSNIDQTRAIKHAKKVKVIAKGLIKAQEADKENYSPILPKMIKK